MIYAELKSKIPKIHKSEDVLTSNVFGFLKVLPQVQILNIIRAIVPQHIAHQLADRKLTKFCLWKTFVNLKEPDVYMKLDPEYSSFHKIWDTC